MLFIFISAISLVCDIAGIAATTVFIKIVSRVDSPHHIEQFMRNGVLLLSFPATLNSFVMTKIGFIYAYIESVNPNFIDGDFADSGWNILFRISLGLFYGISVLQLMVSAHWLYVKWKSNRFARKAGKNEYVCLIFYLFLSCLPFAIIIASPVHFETVGESTYILKSDSIHRYALVAVFIFTFLIWATVAFYANNFVLNEIRTLRFSGGIFFFNFWAFEFSENLGEPIAYETAYLLLPISISCLSFGLVASRLIAFYPLRAMVFDTLLCKGKKISQVVPAVTQASGTFELKI